MAEKKGLGCVILGCVVPIILILLVVGGGYWKITSFIGQFLSEKPMDIEVAEYTPEQITALTNRIAAFATGWEQGQQEQTLELTDEEVTALLNINEELKKGGGKIKVHFNDNKVTGQISIPLAMFNPLMFADKYLTGEAEFDVRCENGLLTVTITGLKNDKVTAPPSVIDQLKKENLAKDAYKDPENVKLLRRIKKIEIIEGKVIITSLPKSEEEATEAAPAEEEAEPAAVE